MNHLVATTIDALEPWVGRMAADTCLRATAISAGKMADELGDEDLPVVEANIRRLLAPVATEAVIASILDRIGEARS